MCEREREGSPLGKADPYPTAEAELSRAELSRAARQVVTSLTQLPLFRIRLSIGGKSEFLLGRDTCLYVYMYMLLVAVARFKVSTRDRTYRRYNRSSVGRTRKLVCANSRR